MLCAINGYRSHFVEPVPDHLKCAICKHALRQPVKSLSCGHLFCKLCYETLRRHYEMMNQVMICPVDQIYFHPAMVLEEKSVEKNVLMLEVHCKNAAFGCRWSGHLQTLDIHVNICRYSKGQQKISYYLPDERKQLETSSSQNENNDSEETLLLMKALKRIERLEERVCQHEETITNMRDDLKAKENQLEALKSMYIFLDSRVKSVDELSVYSKSMDNKQLNFVKDISLKSVGSDVELLIKDASMMSINPSDRSKENAQNSKETAAKSKETAQHSKETAQHSKETAQHGKDSAQHGKDSAQHSKESGQNSKETTQTSEEIAQYQTNTVMNNKHLLEQISDSIENLEKRLHGIEKCNPFSGFFSWTLHEFGKFKRSSSVCIKDDVLTATYGFHCRLIASWLNYNIMSLTVEVLRRTPKTVDYLPLFCELIIACVAGDGQVYSIKMNQDNMSHISKNPDVMCFNENKNFLTFPRQSKFVVKDKLQLFGYFMPYDPWKSP